ncbi:acyltransferase family protein [Streptomyces sp. NPDC016845]|uniref:acyltransferase family protein n=1 Tax=Streptomyces sp. NPDC016845 TaxID=3364972 RepID=UPI0037A2A3E0
MPSAVTCVSLPSLTGLRFVAASGVFVCHVATLDAARSAGWPRPALFLLGPVGVSLFFVLSGFVLTVSAREADSARSFWRRRLVKIYPNHWVVWLLVMALFWCVGMPRPGFGVSDGVLALGDMANALLVHTLVPLPSFVLGGNGVAWSLTCELLFYLLFPWLLPWVVRIPARWLTAAAVSVALAAWTVPLLSLALGGPPLRQASLPGTVTGAQMLLVYLFPPSRLPEFVLGMILARMHVCGLPVRVGTVPSAALLCTALFAGIAVLPAPFLLAAVTVVPVALLVRATAALDLRQRRSVLRMPVLVLLGELSYAFYLVHATVIATVLRYGGGMLGPATAATVSLMVALAASWLLYTHVEQPCIRRFATRLPRPSPAVASTPSPHGGELEGRP